MKRIKGMWLRAGRIVVYTALVSLFMTGASWSAEVLGKYQVVPGNEDTAFLLDTTTGMVWILTHRTMATGREPVAIPYKFIKISPQHKGEFLVELAPGGGARTGGGDNNKDRAP